MKGNKRTVFSIIWILSGALLFGLGAGGIIDDFWGSMGSALFLVGILQMVRFFRLRSNPVYREKMETMEKDERNHYLRSKAWAWAGYLFVLILSVSTLVFRLIGWETMSLAAGYAVCVLLILYWGCYLVLSKKY